MPPLLAEASAPPLSWLAPLYALWQLTWGRIAIEVAGGLLLIGLLCLLYRVLRRLRMRQLLVAFTVGALLLCAGLSVWSFRLPQPRGSVFVLWHQVVRVGAVLSATGTLLGFMSLAIPWVLDRVEGRGFISFVAARHVRAHKSGFLTVISVLSIAGVAVSCFALCAVTSIMGGFGADLKRKILDNNAHVRVETGRTGGFDGWRDELAKIRSVPGIRGATPIAAGEVMASSVSNTSGCLVRGIDTQSISQVIGLLNNVEVGKFHYLEDPQALARLPADEPVGIGVGGEVYVRGVDTPTRYGNGPNGAVAPDPDVYPGIVLGRELAKTLHVYIGDEVTLISPLGEVGPMGLLPRSQRFRVAAVFYSGMYEYDATHAYIKLDVAMKFLDLQERVTSIEIKTADAENARVVRDGVRKVIASTDLLVRDWQELNRNLFNALLLEKITTFIILSIAIAVASFCIICTLLLMVTEKSQEIAILKSLGASDGMIQRLFVTEGLIIGAIGTVFGVSTGWAAAKGLQSYGVRLNPDVYYVDRLPIAVNFSDYVMVAVSALVITAIATIYPARAASRLRPVDGIRYE